VLTRKATKALANRWANQVNQPATIACALLTLDADLRDIDSEVQDLSATLATSGDSNHRLA
jgi:hypothetical protein